MLLFATALSKTSFLQGIGLTFLLSSHYSVITKHCQTYFTFYMAAMFGTTMLEREGVTHLQAHSHHSTKLAANPQQTSTKYPYFHNSQVYRIKHQQLQ